MRRVPLEHGVTFSSVDQSVQNLALVVVPNIAGVLAVAFSVRIALLVVAFVSAVAFALFAWDARPGARARTRTSTEGDRGQTEAAT
jgi:hypothetical protein